MRRNAWADTGRVHVRSTGDSAYSLCAGARVATGCRLLPFVFERELAAAFGEDDGVDQLSDAEVISASLRDPTSFGDLFDRHATVLHRFLVRRIGAVEADTLLGELFLIAFEKRSSFDIGRDSARPWLYGIGTNLIARHRRSEERRLRALGRLATQRQPAQDLAGQVSGAIDASVAWDGVVAGLAALPEAERDTLVLFAWESLSYAEIADSLGIPVGTVRSRISRARGRLRELKPVIDEEPDNNHGRVEP